MEKEKKKRKGMCLCLRQQQQAMCMFVSSHRRRRRWLAVVGQQTKQWCRLQPLAANIHLVVSSFFFCFCFCLVLGAAEGAAAAAASKAAGGKSSRRIDESNMIMKLIICFALNARSPPLFELHCPL